MEVIFCKDCKHRGVVNECPFARYAAVENKNYRDHSVTSADGVYFDARTRIITVCPVKDDDYCSRGEKNE